MTTNTTSSDPRPAATEAADFDAEAERVRLNVWRRITADLEQEDVKLIVGALYHHAGVVPEPLATRYRGIAERVESRLTIAAAPPSGQVCVSVKALRQIDSWAAFVGIWTDEDTEASREITAALKGASE